MTHNASCVSQMKNMNYLLGNKNIVNWGVFAEVEDSTDPGINSSCRTCIA